MNDQYIKQYPDFTVGSGQPNEYQNPKQQSDVEALLLEQTFKNTRLSDLIFDKSRSTGRNVNQRFSKQDGRALVEEINNLKDIIADKDRQIKKLRAQKNPSTLYKEIQFLNNNNHNLFKTIRGLEKQIRILSKEIFEKGQKEKRLLDQIEILNFQVSRSNKMVRKLVKTQKKVLQTQQEEVSKIYYIKSQFEKQNRMLRSQIKSIQKSQMADRTSRSKQSQSQNDVQLATQNNENKQIEIMKKEISKLKHKVKHIGRLKENSICQERLKQK